MIVPHHRKAEPRCSNRTASCGLTHGRPQKTPAARDITLARAVASAAMSDAVTSPSPTSSASAARTLPRTTSGGGSACGRSAIIAR